MDELLAVMYCIDHVTQHLPQLALAELLPEPLQSSHRYCLHRNPRSGYHEYNINTQQLLSDYRIQTSLC